MIKTILIIKSAKVTINESNENEWIKISLSKIQLAVAGFGRVTARVRAMHNWSEMDYIYKCFGNERQSARQRGHYPP